MHELTELYNRMVAEDPLFAETVTDLYDVMARVEDAATGDLLF